MHIEKINLRSFVSVSTAVMKPRDQTTVGGGDGGVSSYTSYHSSASKEGQTGADTEMIGGPLLTDLGLWLA